MRVLMFGPHLDVMGGISAVAQTWFDSEAIKAAEVTYLATTVDGPKSRKLAEGALCEARLLANLARHGPPDLFHIHLSAGASFWRKFAFFQQVYRTGKPVVIHVHGSSIEPFFEKSPVNAAAVRWMFSRAAAVIALYPAFGERVLEWTHGAATVEHLLNPVVLKDLLRPPAQPWPSHPTVLFMGLIGDRKGTFDLMHCVPDVLKAVPEARFRFGGNGEVDKLRALASELGVSHATELLGWVRGPEKRAAFLDASVYCLPSYHEALPVSVLEAMAASLPVVSTTVAGIPVAVEEGVTGYLVAAGDRAALTDRLIRLLRDPSAAVAMGAAGAARAISRFDHEVVTRDLIALWQRTIDRA